MVYDLQGDFPNLPKHSNQHQKTNQAENIPQQYSHTGTNNSATASQVTPDTLSQLHDDMKREFMAAIQQEVKAQIKTEMQAMQTQVANLSTQLGTMQQGIQESIGEAIRASM
jgi:DNA anti-recombination protein RmuC